ncbi:SRPBCC family protein [Actinoplanes sp. NPDC051851]|uniref:SRPBCC family protein n=1 Tax=Actinoplanes sp. NPDC051851 TaxID=3154753 RepID=UPI00341D2266
MERETMGDNASFTYTTYVNTTPERLWRGLTDPALTRRYWGVALESDWAEGSTMAWDEQGVRSADPAQVVLESKPYHRLSYTWHTFTPAWARLHGFDDELLDALTLERRSKVTFTIEPVGDVVKLTVVHDDFEPGGRLVGICREGWPHLLSELKTLLETGETFPR